MAEPDPTLLLVKDGEQLTDEHITGLGKLARGAPIWPDKLLGTRREVIAACAAAMQGDIEARRHVARVINAGFSGGKA